MRVARMAGSFLQAVLVAHGVGLGAAGVGLVREAGRGGLGAQALVGAAPLLVALPLLFLAALSGAVGGGAAGAGAEAALAAGVIRLGESGAAVGAVGVDAGHHRFVTSWATGRPPGAGSGWPSESGGSGLAVGEVALARAGGQLPQAVELPGEGVERDRPAHHPKRGERLVRQVPHDRRLDGEQDGKKPYGHRRTSR